MKPQPIIISILAALFMVPLIGAFAQDAPLITITVITTFDYPGVGNSTTPFGINDRGDIAGDFLDSSNVRRGFVRFANGNFSPPIVEPNDTGNFTRARGINISRVIDGDFFNVADNEFHGYILSGNVFTQFDVGGPVSTDLYGINNGGDFVGAFGSSVQPSQGLINVSGTTTTIMVPNSTFTEAVGVNTTREVVGDYEDSQLLSHGYFRDPNGVLTFPIDFPGATNTFFNGINDKHLIVGRYTDSAGMDHGLFLKMPATFVSFDFPGAAGTSLNGINKRGLISGRYTDSSGIRHGFLAQVSAH